MKKGNREAIVAKAIQDGYLVEETVTVGETSTKRLKNRSLREVLEWKITSKAMTKKAVLEHLQRVASGASGAREKARAEALIPHFKNFRVKDGDESPVVSKG